MKKAPNNSDNQQILFKKLRIILISLIVFLIVIFVAYIIIFREMVSQKAVTQPMNKIQENNLSILEDTTIHKYFEEKTDEFYKEHSPKQVQTKEINKTTQIKPIQIKQFTGTPKIAIIIDDVSYKAQVQEIQSIDYPINMSFLPPTSRHPDSAIIAENLSNVMIHLPLQAQKFEFEEENTLHIDDSYETIEAVIAKVRQLYPNAKYINNHTGSKFSSVKDSTDKLMKAVSKYNFYFLDSRTIASSTICQSANTYNVKCLERNIFLDNEQNYDYIQEQLKKAITIAKRDGQAIAIGHPHKETLQVLKKSKKLFEDMEVVFIEQL